MLPTEAFPAPSVWKMLRHSSQLPLLRCAWCVKVSPECQQHQVIITYRDIRRNGTENTVRSKYAVNKWKQGTEVDDRLSPDAIFTTGSDMEILTGTVDVFIGSRRPITPLLSWGKKENNRDMNYFPFRHIFASQLLYYSIQKYLWWGISSGES